MLAERALDQMDAGMSPQMCSGLVAAMQKLCDAALAEYNTARPGKIALLSFNAKVNSWHRDRMLIKRPLESVILPASCDKVVEEVREFLDAETRRWCSRSARNPSHMDSALCIAPDV